MPSMRHSDKNISFVTVLANGEKGGRGGTDETSQSKEQT